MISGQHETIQYATLEQNKCGLGTAGEVHENVNFIECVEAGDIKIGWKDGTFKTLTLAKGDKNAVNCKNVEIGSGTWNFCRL